MNSTGDDNTGPDERTPPNGSSMFLLRSALTDSSASTVSTAAVLSKQGPNIRNIRSVVVGWIFRIRNEIGFFPEIAYDAISLFDRLLLHLKIDHNNAHLYATASLWISAKMEEFAFRDISLFQLISQKKFSFDQLIEAESIIVGAIHFNLNFSTHYIFLRALGSDMGLDDSAMGMCTFYVDVAMHVFKFIEIPSFMISAASVVLGMESMGIPYKINDILKLVCCNDESALMDLSRDILSLSLKIIDRKSDDVYRFYAGDDSGKFANAVYAASKALNVDTNITA